MQAYSAKPAVPLQGRQWTLTEINGKKVSPDTGNRVPYLKFAAEGTQLTGYDGCNRLMGTYKKAGSSLTIHMVAATLMACLIPDGGQSGFNDALGKTDNYRIYGNTLALFDGKTVLAQFKSGTSNPPNTNP